MFLSRKTVFTEKTNMQTLLFCRAKLRKFSTSSSPPFVFQERGFLDVPFLNGKVGVNTLTVVMNQCADRGLDTTLEKLKKT